MKRLLVSLLALAVALVLPVSRAGTLNQTQDPARQIQVATNYEEANRFLEAIRQYWKVLEADPRHEIAALRLADLLFRMGRYTEGYDVGRNFLRLRPESFKMHLILAEALQKRVRFAEAREEIGAFFKKAEGKVGRKASEWVYALYLEGKNHLKQNQFREGEERFLQVLKLNPAFVEAHLELARFYSQEEGTYEKAVQHSRKAVKLDPELTAAHLILGKVLLNLGENQSAIVHLEKVIQLEPSSAEAFFDLAAAARKQGDYDKMKQMLARFQALQSEGKGEKEKRSAAATFYQEGEEQFTRGELRKALQSFEKARDLAPERSRLEYLYPTDRSYYGIAWVHITLGNTREARKNIEYAIGLYPYEARYQYLYAECLGLLQENDGAISAMRKAIGLNPFEARYHNLLGNFLFKRGAFQESASSYGRAVELDPENALFRLNLSTALAKTGSLSENKK